MHLSVSALSAALLAFSWESEPGVSYTLQTSTDLNHWSTVSTVFEGDGQPLSLAFNRDQGRLFARLRSSAEGDTNGNEIPDTWEWSTFGYLDVPAMADPDLDGFTTLDEWRSGSDPLDPYNGLLPILRNASGKIWHVPPGTTSLDYTDLQLRDIYGAALPHRKITVSTASGDACLVPADIANADIADTNAAAHWELQTDAFGNIRPRNGVRYRNDGTRDGTDALLITAGSTSTRIVIALDPLPDHDPPFPRELHSKRVRHQRTEVSWSGVPLPDTELIFEKYDDNRGWERLLRLPAAELTAPDPVTGRFTHIIPDTP